ncbi:FkbM family methyltransferase [candidate division WWE3 bacterium]|nr:FkbM family methyltransferase [candidate division WWE3 bacterium]
MVWLIVSSLKLDLGLLVAAKWNAAKKIEFLYKKYGEIFLLVFKFKKFKLGESFVKLFGKKVFYDSAYGIAGYQRMLVTHQKMLNFAKMGAVETVVDVGANVGFFSMMVRDKFPRSKIYAIEPVPAIFTCLKKNLDSKLDRVFNVAISSKKGFVEMAFDENNSARSHIVENHDTKKDGNLVRVEAERLDAFCEEHAIGSIDILKIDTETFESFVLEGGQKILQNTRFIHIEINIEDNNNYTFSKLNSLLYSSKFDFQLVCYRNYSDRGEGPIAHGDFLFKNILLVGK